ncbi:MAG: PDZ domain-containing protein [Planctomycetota bacterium]|nr:PDZ domain-containing protein [Planctomycetota bacterium]
MRPLAKARLNAPANHRMYARTQGQRFLRRGTILVLTAGLALSLGIVQAQPQPAPPLPTDPSAHLEMLMSEGKWADAEAFTRRLLELKPDEFTLHYNLACVLAHQGRSAEAITALKAAIERGFDDVRQLQRDPDLVAVRDTPEVRQLISRWPEILDARRQANEAAFPNVFKEKYERVAEDARRIVYFSAFEPAVTAQARRELDVLATWAEKTLFSGLFEPSQAALDPWVMVTLPRRDDFRRWSVASFGPAAMMGFSTIGGQYLHDTKQLVAQDLGATLRHEFLHALHWRHMDRLGQKHAFWIQEGLGCLVEDTDLQPNGTLVAAPSWRTNTAKRRERSAILMPLEKLCAMTREQFVHPSQVMGNYAQSRTFFMYLQSRGQLSAWYSDYVAHFADDPTGATTTRRVLGGSDTASWDAINRAYRLWVRTIPDVAEEIAVGKASLGVTAESGEGDGVRLVETPTKAQFPEDLAPAARLRRDDVILSIDGRPTRDLAELVRVLDGKQVGDVTAIEFRRGREVLASRLVLIPKAPPNPRSLIGP